MLAAVTSDKEARVKKDQKTPGKLTLHRETLRHLEDKQLREAAGGAPANSGDLGSWRSCVSDVQACYTDRC
jgi:hypothetical protein